MTAIRAQSVGALSLVTLLTGGLSVATLVRHAPHAGSPELAEPPADDPVPQAQQLTVTADPARPLDCESPNIKNVVLRGQFIAHTSVVDHFAIQLPGKSGSYSAITNSRGYFEMRIPREDFADDLCNLDWWHSFSDDSMTLQYIVDFE